MVIRRYCDADADAVWAILAPMLRAGDTYTLPADWSRDDMLGYWLSAAHSVFVAEVEGKAVGTYYIKANQKGGGSHVSNCGFVTDVAAMGRGVARAMCEHALGEAKRQGFRAMQFNFVVSTNTRALALWQSLGFAVVGTLPQAFKHPRLGYVDAFVLYREI